MAYSGTVNQTKISVAQLIEYAFREAGKTAEEQTPEYINAAKQALFYILQSLSNKGVNLWAIETKLLGALEAQTVLPLPEGTVGILAANWRYIQTPNVDAAYPVSNVDAITLFNNNNEDLNLYVTTSASPNNYFGWSYQESQIITQIGINAYVPSGTATYNLVLETSNDNITWTERQQISDVVLADKEWHYFQLDLTPGYLYYRLKSADTSTFSLRCIAPSYVQQDIPLAPLNRDTYFALPNKQFQSARSLQYWYNKGVEQSMYLWPIPENNFQCFQIVIERQLQDVGTLSDEIYMPNRWLNALQSMLSHKVAMQLPGVDGGRITMLERLAKENFMDASNGEEDKAPIYFQPNYSYYTR